MKRIALLSMLVVASGCATATPKASFPVASLRERNGACVFQQGVVLCAQKGAPNTINDDRESPYLLVKVQDYGWQLSNTGNWQLTVVDPDGRTLLQKVLKKQVPELGLFVVNEHLKWSLDVVQLPEPWRQGTYRFRMVCTFDTTNVRDFELTLMDGATLPPASKPVAGSGPKA